MGGDFIALCRRPPPSYTIGEVDIELSMIPKSIPQSSEILDRAFEGLQARADESTLRFRVVINSLLEACDTTPMPRASLLDMGLRVEVMEFDVGE